MNSLNTCGTIETLTSFSDKILNQLLYMYLKLNRYVFTRLSLIIIRNNVLGNRMPTFCGIFVCQELKIYVNIYPLNFQHGSANYRTPVVDHHANYYNKDRVRKTCSVISTCHVCSNYDSFKGI